MITRLLAVSITSFATIVLCGACHVDAKVKASTSDDAPITDRSDTETASPAEPAAPAAAAAAPAPPSAPPADACPLVCFEARGGERVSIGDEEVAQLRTSLEPVLGRMRTCTSPEDWRRHGSPVINLRLGPDGTLADLGVDPHHGREAACFEDAGRGGATLSLSLPGRKVVRCSERCERTKTAAPGSRGRRRRAR